MNDFKKKKKQTDKQFIQNIRKEKKQHFQTTDQTTSSLTEKTKCCACKQDHDFHVCYYLFFNKAPDWFTLKMSVQQHVEQNLKKDTDLAEEVK